MKNLKKLMFVISACLLITACGPKSPREVVKTVITASQKLDFETLKKHIPSKRMTRLEEKEKNFKENPDEAADFILMVKDAKIEFISETISEDGNSATVTVKISNVKGADEAFENNIDLIKENGEWKFDESPF
ncbi:MAG: DUF4878 domain-containing protein [Prevotellaceae bacterium]|jgi:ABC-type transporter MlaC component|nr:DUF4878 domain-containing protein [Prevotellaceae bacterium]